jgi:glycosyltransferase involved in cell wall biosynthesis
MRKASAIIPAYNEAERIAAVIEPLLQAEQVGEIIIVDDHSIDGTGDVAKRYGVRVLKLAENLGKASALAQGARVAQFDVLLFFDADLVGLKPSHADFLISLFYEEELDMLVGVFRNGRINTDLAQTIAPYLSGQRVIHRRHWDKLLDHDKIEFGVEMALTKLSLKENWAEKRVFLDGVTHVLKEEKRGFSEGFRERLHMYGDIIRTLFIRVG